ncbi:MAG: replicative DNA helicase [Candidatus Omnitrophica bacterium]|nr:replicative DNA helicase [Candidatus Omnitrophota bacterium]
METGGLTAMGKVPPQNLEAEMAVLGSMLLSEEAIMVSIEILDRGIFYDSKHQKVYEAIIELFNQEKAADVVTVCDELKRKGMLEDIGGASYIAELANSVPTAANVAHYAKIVKDKGILRELINRGTQIVNEATEAQENTDQIVDHAERLIYEISERRITGGSLPIRSIIHDTIEKIDTLYQKKEHVTGIPTGFIHLDRQTAGMQPSDLIVIAARPSMGKSALAISMADHIGVEKKMPLVIFSLEMSREQLVQRLLCAHARVDAHNVRTGYLSTSDWPKLTAAAGKLSQSPIYIDDTPAMSVIEIRAKARRMKLHHDIKFVIVDYLQLMRGSAGSENRQQEISDISRSLKALARELSIPVVAISQLSRAVEARPGHRPQLSDLRESGAIEQDADVVILLYREDYYSQETENKGVTEINIAKQRNGPVGTIKLTFIKEYMKFESLAVQQV